MKVELGGTQEQRNRRLMPYKREEHFSNKNETRKKQKGFLKSNK